MPLKPVMPVASGGLSIRDIPKLIKIFGKDVVIQIGGGIHAHPKGTLEGARAARKAIDASA
jgi:ribulose-bisphosphate carboxylase large chain